MSTRHHEEEVMGGAHCARRFGLVDLSVPKEHGHMSGHLSGTIIGPARDTKGRTLPTDARLRKDLPIVAGCLDYFPNALAGVAELSRRGNEQHNPGQPMHWARGKSQDHAECIVRHLMERGTLDTDGIPHSVKVAWRALALAQTEHEALYGLPMSRGSSA